MALDPQYIVPINLEEYFVNHDTGEPLANGTIEFWTDDDRTTPKDVFELTGAPPNYTYDALPNPLNLSAVGTPVDNSGNPVSIYYYPYDAFGNVELYYIVVKDSNGLVQFTREAWPNTVAGGSTTQNVADGGTGRSSFTPYAVICGGTTSTGQLQNVAGLGNSGDVLTSNGALALPTWQTPASTAVAATQAELETATSTTTFSSPGRQQFHPSACKAWVNFNGTGTVAIRGSYNVTSITDLGVGLYYVNMTTPMSSTNYSFSATGRHGSNGTQITYVTASEVTSASQFYIVVQASAGGGGGRSDPDFVFAQAFGDQ